MTSTRHSLDEEPGSSSSQEGETAGVTAEVSLLREEVFKLNTEEARRRTVALLQNWTRDGRLAQVRSRTQTLTAVALSVFVASAVLSGSAGGITETIATTWFWVSGAVSVLTGSVAFLLRGSDDPTDYVLEGGTLASFGTLVLAVGGTHYTRHPLLRAAWRYLITGPHPDHSQLGSPGEFGAPSDTQVATPSRTGATPNTRGETETNVETVQQYVRLAGGISAVLVILHQVWVTRQGGTSALSSVFRDSGTGLLRVGTNLAPVEAAGVLVAVATVGALVGMLLAASGR